MTTIKSLEFNDKLTKKQRLQCAALIQSFKSTYGKPYGHFMFDLDLDGAIRAQLVCNYDKIELYVVGVEEEYLLCRATLWK